MDLSKQIVPGGLSPFWTGKHKTNTSIRMSENGDINKKYENINKIKT